MGHFNIHQKLLFCFIVLWVPSLYSASHRPQEFLDSIRHAPNEGAAIAQHYCLSCHAEQPLIQVGAPKIGDETDWTPRLRQSLSLILQHSEEGVGAMPARGGCFECSDEQLILAIKSLLPIAKQKNFMKHIDDYKKSKK